MSLDSISKSFRRGEIVDDAKIEKLKRWYPSAVDSESARHATAPSPAATPCREPAGSGVETSASIDFSIILPAYNEEACVELLYKAIVEALESLRRGFEIVFVDDGSTDATFARFEALAHADARVRVIKFRRNCGQTAAMAAGIEYAEGAVLVTMDADLQNDPADIPRLLRKIEEGYALVVGWRHNRQDRLLSRKLPSALANWLIARVTGIDIKDNGCSLKAYRADLIKVIPLYSEMHRFIPAMVAMAGGRIAQIKVRHHPRQFGRSKYGLSRVHKVLLDLVIIKMLLLLARRPLFCFSGAAAITGVISAATLAVEVSPVIHGAPPSVVFMSLPILFGSLAIFLFLLGVVGFLIYEGGVDGLRRGTGLAQQRAPAVQARTDPPARPRKGGRLVSQNVERVLATGVSGVRAAEPASDAANAAAATALSVLVPVNQDRDDIGDVYLRYREVIGRLGRPYEMIYVVGRDTPGALHALKALKEHEPRLQIIVFGQWFGEPAALASGFQHARGDIVMTLPADPQIDPADLPRVLAALDGCDMAVGRRCPLVRSPVQRLQAKVFHGLLRWLFGHRFNDLVCRVRACRRSVLEEIAGFGLDPHFLPLLASERGFRTQQVDVRPGETGAEVKLSFVSWLRIALDILALYLVLKFTKRPLRFFGLIGLPMLMAGLLYTGGLATARLFYGVALAGRPSLVLGVLMLVLGIQIVALGLIGELIIFVSGRRIKDYSIEKIVSARTGHDRRRQG